MDTLFNPVEPAFANALRKRASYWQNEARSWHRAAQLAEGAAPPYVFDQAVHFRRVASAQAQVYLDALLKVEADARYWGMWKEMAV